MDSKKIRTSWNKGLKRPAFSEQWKKNMSLGHLGKSSGMLGKKHSEETKRKQSSYLKTPDQVKKQIEKTKRGASHPMWNGGPPKCIDCGLQRNAYANKNRCRKCADKYHVGKNNPNWKGGVKKSHVRRKRKLNNGGLHTFGEWENLKIQYDYICPACGKSEPEIILTEDHIIPLSKGGSDNIENIQPLCKKCNLIKYTKIIKYDKKTKLDNK